MGSLRTRPTGPGRKLLSTPGTMTNDFRRFCSCRRAPIRRLKRLSFFRVRGWIRCHAVEPLGDMEFVDYVIQSGRAVMYPIYKGTYNRPGETGIPRQYRRLRRTDPAGERGQTFGRLSGNPTRYRQKQAGISWCKPGVGERPHIRRPGKPVSNGHPAGWRFLSLHRRCRR